MSDEIVSIEVSITYRSYQADKPLQRLSSCFVLGFIHLVVLSLSLCGFIPVYSLCIVQKGQGILIFI